MFASRRAARVTLPGAAPTLYMDAVITPNRSLSKRAFALMLAGLAAYNLLVMGFLFAIGAFPVPIFLGLDFVGLYVAFKISYRRGGFTERVQVSAERVQVTHQDRGRTATVWSTPTAFTRVLLERAGEHEARVRLTMSNRRINVGGGLSPGERDDFAAALDRAIRSARGERHAV